MLRSQDTRPTVRTALRLLLAAGYLAAAWFHFTAPGPFIRIVPGFVPGPAEVVFWTGVAEGAGALALAQPWWKRLRQVAGAALALYALCVWPANINHLAMDVARPDGGWGAAYHVPRMLVQPLLIWLALWTGRVTDWPFARR